MEGARDAGTTSAAATAQPERPWGVACDRTRPAAPPEAGCLSVVETPLCGEAPGAAAAGPEAGRIGGPAATGSAGALRNHGGVSTSIGLSPPVIVTARGAGGSRWVMTRPRLAKGAVRSGPLLTGIRALAAGRWEPGAGEAVGDLNAEAQRVAAGQRARRSGSASNRAGWTVGAPVVALSRRERAPSFPPRRAAPRGRSRRCGKRAWGSRA